METKKTSFSPSVNIIRDSEKDLNYVVTKNSIRVATQILSDFSNHIHSFSIIGSYGTGKSSFLWALEKNFKKEKEYFFELRNHLNGLKRVKYINIVGSYSPIEEVLHKALRLRTEPTLNNVLDGFQRVYSKCKREKEFLVIVIDEFGKILEYAAQHNPEDRMFFLQQLAEFINDPEHNIILINTLHQNFNAYSSRLRTEQKQEWNKVRGRFVELTFNEPVEQLLFLAANQIKQWNFLTTGALINKKKDRAILDSGLLPISNAFANSLAIDLLPLDLLSGSTLTHILKDYGQNERSLFTFLAMRSPDSLYAYGESTKSFDLVELYNYVYSNFYTHIDDKHNRDKNKWDRIKISLDRLHTHFDEDKNLAEQIIKTIGIISIYGNKGGRLNEEFLVNYIGKREISRVLKRLAELRIILFRKHLSSFSLTEGTDLDYYEAIEEASSKIDPTFDLVTHLNKFYSLPYVNAKRVSYEVGTPRFFKFSITDELLDEKPFGEIDGIIYLIFNSELKDIDIKRFSKRSGNANIYVRYKNTIEIKKTILEIKKIEFVQAGIEYDKVAEEELLKMFESLRSKLNNDILNEIYNSPTHTSWFLNGEIEKSITSEKALNALLSKAIEQTYFKTPEIKNELINKHKISTAISTARKKYVKALLDRSSEKDLGFEESKYPPEKTIYETLLKSTGLHRQLDNEKYGFYDSKDAKIKELLTISKEFLHQSTEEQKSLSDFIKALTTRPYKLKEGLIKFWLPTYLIMKHNEYALFKDGHYIPFLSTDLFDLIYKDPGAFSIRAYPFGGIEVKVFNQYRDLFEIPKEDVITNQKIIETIRPFLLFYKELPVYAKQTDLLSPNTKDFRNAISHARDPYSAFFETFPKSFGYNNVNLRKNKEALDNYVIALKKSINELRAAYNELLDRYESSLKKLVNQSNAELATIKNSLEKRFETIEIDRISLIHKRLLGRIRAPFENKQIWLESIAMTIMDKPLREFSDEDEEILYKNLSSIYQDLIDLLPLHKANQLNDANHDSVFGVKIIQSNGESFGFQAVLNGSSKVAAELKKEISLKTVGLEYSTKRTLAMELIKMLVDEQNES